MATVRNVGPNFTLNASNVYVLGDTSDEQANGGFLVQIIDGGSYAGSIVVQAQSWQARRLGLSDNFVPIEYRGGYVNGSAAAWGYISTALTTNSLLFIPAGGMEVALSVTFTSGSASALVIPVTGSCAF